MYKVMKAVHDSRLPMNFKGSMVLKAILLESGYSDSIRHTIDIDSRWFSDIPPSIDFIASSIQKALDDATLPYTIIPTRNYGNGQSAGFKFESKQSGRSDFTMDMEIGIRPRELKIYEVNGCCFSGVVASSILADKILVVSSRKIFRRMKDLVDLYYLSKVVILRKEEVKTVIASNYKTLGDFVEFLHMKDNLRHAYDKFIPLEEAEKIPFEDLYSNVKDYIKDFLPND